MSIFKKRKQETDTNNDQFDRSLTHIGGDFPLETRNKIWKELFYPVIRAGFNQNITDEAIEDASLIRIKANGSMHTRIVIDDGLGVAVDAIDVDGRIGELLWVLCKNPGNPDIITEPKNKKIMVSYDEYIMMIWDELLERKDSMCGSAVCYSPSAKPSDQMAYKAILAMLSALEKTYDWDRGRKRYHD